MIWVDYNETHFLNINQVVVVKGFANEIEFANNFSPDNWTLKIRKQDIPELSAIIIRPLIFLLMLTGIVLKKDEKEPFFFIEKE